MLFNTFAFAEFFALVFSVSWLLVNRRYVPLLPWVGLVGYVAFGGSTSPLAWGLTCIALALSLGVVRLTPEGATPTLRNAAAAVAINYVALAWLTFRDSSLDPLLLALRTLGVPVGTGTGWIGVAVIITPVLLVTLLRARKIRMIFLLFASYVFYAHWDWRFLPLIWFSSTVDWLLGNAIYAHRDRPSRKYWIIGTVVVNLGILGIFKYFNFGVDSARAVLESFGLQPPEVVLRVALPVGISFFTFESMSYVIDIYRGDIKPQKSYVEYLSFVAFFPHLVAGPIVRPRDLLPQLAGPARWAASEGSEGLFLIALGLLKKVAIGDYVALNLVDRVFDAPTQYSALECYTGVLGYAVQIYCDFSGYTDIAIGTALLLGVRMPLNFNAPYKAPEIIDFWRRWHISLSTWLRDYLYITLGGNRRGRARTYVNLMVTMLLGGLWHGAGWTFVVWGGLHGWALAVTRAVGEATGTRARSLAVLIPALAAGPILGTVMCALLRSFEWRLWGTFLIYGWLLGGALAVGATYHDWARRHRPPKPAGGLLRDERRDIKIPPLPAAFAGKCFYFASVFATFHVVCAGWIFFRAPSFREAATFFTQLATFTTHHSNLHWKVLLVLVVGLVSHWLPERWYIETRESFIRLPAPVQGLALYGAAFVLRQMASAETVPFVYFQF